MKFHQRYPTPAGPRRSLDWLKEFSYLCCIALSGVISLPLLALEYPAVDCIINPHRVVDLGSPVAGVIEEVLVERSDYVTEGQVVARLDVRVEGATVALARARARVESQLKTELINVEFDNRRKQRIDSLYGQKVVSIDNKDAADRDAQLSVWRLEQARDLQLVRQLELRRAEKLVEQKTIRSTINGFVIQRFKSRGEYVEDQPILRIAQLDPLNIEAIMPMKYFGIIHPGLLAEVRPETVSPNPRQARVTVVDRIGDAASGTFGVRLEMDNPGFEIPAGLKCELKFMAPPSLVDTTKPDRISSSPQSRDLEQGLDYQAEDHPQSRSDHVTKYAVGPFEDRESFEKVKNSLHGIAHTDRQESVSELVGFIVLTKELSDTERLQMQDRLALRGVRHFVYFKQPPYQRRYSLGVYDKKNRATTRVLGLEKLGIKTGIERLTRQKTQWWFEVEISAQSDESSLELLRNRGYSVQPVQIQSAG